MGKKRCTIMLDGWNDQRNHTIIKFLIFCPQGTMFLRSVDVSDRVKDAHFFFHFLDEVVEDVGVANVGQIIIGNGPKYVLVGKLLEEKHKTIFWTPCDAHCIDIMLEDISKIYWIKNTVGHAKSIKIFIYNHSWILNLMRKDTGGKDIVRLVITRFETHFLTLQSMISQHINLKKVFCSDEWNECKWSCKQDGKYVKKKVNEEIFWINSTKVVKVTEPLVKVLRLVDREILDMGFIYEAMVQAKEQKGPFWKSLIKDGTINSIALYMQVGTF